MPTAIREKLVVMVPCYNEEALVARTVEAIDAEIPAIDMDVEVHLIDDGSVDRTRAEMEKLCRRFGYLRMVVNPKNLGVGRSCLNVYASVAPDTWVTGVPGDNEIDFRSIHNYCKVRHDYDIILGYSHNPIIRTVTRRMASEAFTKVVSFLYGFPYRYINGQQCIRAWAYQGIEVVSSGHAFAAELLAKALLRHPTLRVGEVPFVLRGRSSGVSKAFHPRSIATAIAEVYRGHRSVADYRERVIAGTVSTPR